MTPDQAFPMVPKVDPSISVTIQKSETEVTQEKILADTDAMLSEFAADYKKMAE